MNGSVAHSTRVEHDKAIQTLEGSADNRGASGRSTARVYGELDGTGAARRREATRGHRVFQVRDVRARV